MSKTNRDSGDAGGNDLDGKSKRVRDNNHTDCSAASGTAASRDGKQAVEEVQSVVEDRSKWVVSKFVSLDIDNEPVPGPSAFVKAELRDAGLHKLIEEFGLKMEPFGGWYKALTEDTLKILFCTHPCLNWCIGYLIKAAIDDEWSQTAIRQLHEACMAVSLDHQFVFRCLGGLPSECTYLQTDWGASGWGMVLQLIRQQLLVKCNGDVSQFDNDIILGNFDIAHRRFEELGRAIAPVGTNDWLVADITCKVIENWHWV
jgi:hypothetical protein